MLCRPKYKGLLMKKLFLLLALLMFPSILFAGWVQTYKVIYSSSAETSLFIMVDDLKIGTSTSTWTIELFGSSGVVHCNYIECSTATFDMIYGNGQYITNLSTALPTAELQLLGQCTGHLYVADQLIGQTTGHLYVVDQLIGQCTGYEYNARIAQDQAIGITTATIQALATSNKTEIDALHVATATEITARIAGDQLLGQSTTYVWNMQNYAGNPGDVWKKFGSSDSWGNDDVGAAGIDTDCRISTGIITFLEGGTEGDMIQYDGAAWVKVPKGAAGQVWTMHADSASWTTAASGGSGKAVIHLNTENVHLPNSGFARPDKVVRTYGVDHVLKFEALATGTTESAYFTDSCPAFYGGGAWTITSYCVLETTETGTTAQITIGVRAKEHDEAWDAAFTTIGTIDVVPTGTAEDLLVDVLTGGWGSDLPTAGDLLEFEVTVKPVNCTFVSFDGDLPVIDIKIEED